MRVDVVDKLPPQLRSLRVNVGLIERILSAAAGAALAAYGLKRSSAAGIGLAAAGSALLFRGVTGFCPVNESIGRDSSDPDRQKRGIEIRTSLTVGKPRNEVYAYWRKLENLPLFMEHLADVRQVDERRSEWSAPIPKTGAYLDWRAEIEAEEENSRLAWRSVEGSQIHNAGEVRFEDAPGGRGTMLHVRITYEPPAGAVGAAASRLVNPAFEQMVKEDVRRFKRIMETGEIPTTEGQPSGAR